MKINISEISVSFAKAFSCSIRNDGEIHKKTLPFLSIVSPQNGYYEISINDEKPVIVKKGECFVVAANVFHTIVHHIEPGCEEMNPKWIFLNIKYLKHIDLTSKINPFIVIKGDEGKKFEEYIDRMLLIENKKENINNSMERISVSIEAFCKLVKMSDDFELIESTIIDNALNYINLNLDKKIIVQDLANICHISRSSFFSAFTKTMGLSPNEYIIQKRLTFAAALLISDNLTLADIAQKTGFYDEYHLSRAFKEKYGISPSKYRREIY